MRPRPCSGARNVTWCEGDIFVGILVPRCFCRLVVIVVVVVSVSLLLSSLCCRVVAMLLLLPFPLPLASSLVSLAYWRLVVVDA